MNTSFCFWIIEKKGDLQALFEIEGGEREAILASILGGRGGDMPAFSSRLNLEKLEAVVDSVLSLRNE
jgi:mono/diheme cytochrome c family protein